MEIKQIIRESTKGLNEEWPLLYKIRYIYLKLGSLLQKDTDFFFSIDDKLDDKNFSIRELGDIYNNIEGRNSKVICRSASYLLKLAYDSVGIKSKMVKSNNNVTNVDKAGESLVISHWMLAVEDVDDIYFVSLASDLPYIQMGMKTPHFGSNIPYMKEDSKGNLIQVYEGEEIKHTVIDLKKLEKVDQDIGYIKYYYPYDNDNRQAEHTLQYEDSSLLFIRDAARNNKLYYEIEIENTSFYRNLIEFEGAHGKWISLYHTSVDNLTKEDWNIWIRNLCSFISEKVDDLVPILFDSNVMTPNWNYDIWFKDMCIKLQYYIFLQLNRGVHSDFSEFEIKSDFSYKEWSRKVKKEFKASKDEYDYDNILLILDKVNSLVNYVRKDGKKTNFMTMFNKLAYHFIPSDKLYVNNLNDGFISNFYIANKFIKVFGRHFGCNDYLTDFNKMDYSEQVVIIKQAIMEMFPEINAINSNSMKGYDDKYSAILNRIQLYPIKSREDGAYSIVFNIIGDEREMDYYYFYNPKTNEFKIADILDIYVNYIIVSGRFKSRIEGIEDVELSYSRKK